MSSCKVMTPLIGVNSFVPPETTPIATSADDLTELRRIADSVDRFVDLQTALRQSLAMAALATGEPSDGALTVVNALVPYLIRNMDPEPVDSVFVAPDKALSIATGWTSTPLRRLSHAPSIFSRHLAQARAGYRRISENFTRDTGILRQALPLAQRPGQAAAILVALRERAQTTWDTDARYLIPGSHEA